MGGKNAFLKKMQAQSDAKMMSVGCTMSQWASQIALDALVKTLGYGDCMKNDQWGGTTHYCICERVAGLCR